MSVKRPAVKDRFKDWYFPVYGVVRDQLHKTEPGRQFCGHYLTNFVSCIEDGVIDINPHINNASFSVGNPFEVTKLQEYHMVYWFNSTKTPGKPTRVVIDQTDKNFQVLADEVSARVCADFIVNRDSDSHRLGANGLWHVFIMPFGPELTPQNVRLILHEKLVEFDYSIESPGSKIAFASAVDAVVNQFGGRFLTTHWNYTKRFHISGAVSNIIRRIEKRDWLDLQDEIIHKIMSHEDLTQIAQEAYQTLNENLVVNGQSSGIVVDAVDSVLSNRNHFSGSADFYPPAIYNFGPNPSNNATPWDHGVANSRIRGRASRRHAAPD